MLNLIKDISLTDKLYDYDIILSFSYIKYME